MDGLQFDAAGAVAGIDESYRMLHGKRRICRHQANQQAITFANANGAKFSVVLRVANDGVAFRYEFPDSDSTVRTVTGESTGFRLPADATAWIQPFQEPSKYTPAYEEYYQNGIPSGTASPNEAGWVLPALFHVPGGDRWVLLAEAAGDGTYCGTRLAQQAANGVYRVRFPQPGEGNGVGEVRPRSTLALGHAVAGDPSGSDAGRDLRIDADQRPEPAHGGRQHGLDQAGPGLVELVVGPRQPARLQQAEGVRGPGGGDGLGVLAGRRQLDADGWRQRAAAGQVCRRQGRGPVPVVQLGRPAQQRDGEAPRLPARSGGPAVRVQAAPGLGHQGSQSGLLPERQAGHDAAVPGHPEGRRGRPGCWSISTAARCRAAGRAPTRT